MLQQVRSNLPVQRGKVGEWRIVEGGGASLFDYGSGRNNGTFVNTPAWVATGLDFVPAESDHITTALMPTTPGSLQCLLATDTFAAARIPIGTIGAANTRVQIITANDGSNDLLGGGVGAQASATIKSTTVLATGRWVLGTLTWDGTTVQLYFNATREYSGAQSGSVTTAQPFYIGAVNNNGAPGSLFDGKIKWAAVYNRVLSAQEVAQNLRFARRLAAIGGVVI